MLLYHFISERFGLDAIRDRRLKIAVVNHLNDPFEFQSLQNENETVQEKLKGVKNIYSYDHGFISLSTDWQHPLMWSHYAEKHKGICLGFDVRESEELVKVDYKNKRPKLMDLKEENDSTSNADLDIKDCMKLLSLKFDGWAYESERRLFSPLAIGDPTKELYFREFTDEFKLCEVILGIKSDIPNLKLERILGDKVVEIKCFRGDLHKNEFKVSREQIHF